MKISVSRIFFVLFVVVIACSSIFFLLTGCHYWPFPKQLCAKVDKNQIWTDKQQLEYANLLLSKGLKNEAAQAFEGYIKKSNIGIKDLVSVCYRLANLYMDIREYEKALGVFYKIEILNINTDFKEEMNRQIVEALEKSGMTQEAQYELAKRTSVAPVSDKDMKVIAKIGDEKIYEQDLNQVLDKMPEWIREKLRDPKAKADFVKEYVTQEVLYRKAKRLGLEKDPGVRQAAEQINKQLIIEKMLEEELNSNMKISREDLELYYNANKDKYVEPEKIKISYAQLKDETSKEGAIQQLKDGKGLKSDGWIYKEQAVIPGLEELEKKDVDALFAIEEGSLSDVLKVKDNSYVFLIDEKQTKLQKSFDEVLDLVENEYRAQKRESLASDFIKKTLEEQKVEILDK